MIDIADLIQRNRSGEAIGLPCFCTANEHVLRAVLAHAAATGAPTVIEATCNQVNQDGGYTGMTPAGFIDWLRGLAADAGVSMDSLILGGDHLGPNPWRAEPLDVAMDKARVLVRDYVAAGFRKIHLDASMACGDEVPPSFEQIAERAADLCAVAEEHAPDPANLIYIIGTEVPIPGGETEEPDALDVTSVARFRHCVDTHRAAFAARGLDAAWGRIVSVVTQPGVDFGHTSIFPFEPEKSRDLSTAILSDPGFSDQGLTDPGLTDPGLTFEAHSTDYQSTGALADLVKQHFFFLKVGPELTFRLRESVWALSRIEDELDVAAPSGIRQVLETRMSENPGYWQDYYSGADVVRQRVYSYSDRIRYYWTDAAVRAALDRLLANLAGAELPETLVSQMFTGSEFGEIGTDATALLQGHIQRCVTRYFKAAGFA